MNNIKEKLEISKWLYEEGLEPDLQFSYNYVMQLTEGQITSDDWRLEPTKVFKNKVNLREYLIQPWFSLERVLELLPKKLKIGEHISLLQFWEGRKGYVYDAYNQDDSIYVEANNYHLAALKLLKKVIETYEKEIINGN